MSHLNLPELIHTQIAPGPVHSDNMMGANNDSEALTLFLNKSGARSSETRRRYEREIIRFTAFIYQELGVDYRGTRLKHLQTYLHFIQNLPEHWLSPGILPGQPERVLFRESIKEGKSTDQVIDVLSTFFSFLERNRYTQGNPAASLVRTGEKKARGNSVVRFFHDSEWHHVKSCLNNMPLDTQKQVNEAARTRYMLTTSYSLALRASELTGHSCNDIHPDGEDGLFLSVLGKGRKRRKLPLNSGLQSCIMDYRRFHGLTGLAGDGFPLAPRTRKSAGQLTALTARGLRFWWQGFMTYCAMQTNDEVLARRLSEMPLHSLRHTALTHLARKMDIEDLAIFAGHDSINTTSQYYHTEAKRLKSLTAEHLL
ncbi:MAG: tyrosine-type recombinase/integrase [Endozoicomonas sp.]